MAEKSDISKVCAEVRAAIKSGAFRTDNEANYNEGYGSTIKITLPKETAFNDTVAVKHAVRDMLALQGLNVGLVHGHIFTEGKDGKTATVNLGIASYIEGKKIDDYATALTKQAQSFSQKPDEVKQHIERVSKFTTSETQAIDAARRYDSMFRPREHIIEIPDPSIKSKDPKPERTPVPQR